MTWLEEFRPQTLDDCIGVRSEFNAIKQFFASWKEERPIGNLLLLAGLAGTGKTTIVHAIAADLDMDVTEVNASIVRTKEPLTTAIAPAYLSSFGNRKRILLLDESDGIKAWQVVEDIAKNPPCAIVMTANDQSKIPYAVRKQSLQFNLQPPTQRHRLRLVDRICDAKSLMHGDAVRHKIAESCTSWRSVVATLQTTPENIDVESLEVRLHDVSQIQAVQHILKGKAVPKAPRNITILNHAVYNGCDVADGVLLLQWSRSVAGLAKVSQAWAEALRVKGPIDTPPFRNVMKKKQATTTTKATRTEPTPKKESSVAPPPKTEGFGGFFS